MDCPCGKNHRFRLQFSCVRAHQLAVPFVLQGEGFPFPEFHPQLIRMLPKFHSQIKSVNPWKPRIIIHLIGVQHLSAAHGILLQHHQVQSRPFSVYGSRETRRTGADDNQVVHLGFSPFLFILYAAVRLPRQH